MILNPNVSTMVETHFELDIIVKEVDNRMVVIQIQVGKNTFEDVLLDGGANVNIITENLRTKLGLPKLKLLPYHLIMAKQSMIRPLRIIKNLKIYIHDIPYI
jgi:hypothetical protein